MGYCSLIGVVVCGFGLCVVCALRGAVCASCAVRMQACGHAGMRVTGAQCVCGCRCRCGYARVRPGMPERASERVPMRARACLHVCARACACVCVCACTHPTHPPPPFTYLNNVYAPYAYCHKLPLPPETAPVDTPFSDSVLTLTAQGGKVCGPGLRGCLASQSLELCQRVIQV